MTDAEWEKLRTALLQRQFGEDIVQQVLLELLELLSKGVAVLNPLHWSLKCAKRRAKNENRRAMFEREGKETLEALRIPYDTRTPGEQERARKRRYKRNQRARRKAA